MITSPALLLHKQMHKHGINATQLAKHIGVSRATISRLLNGAHLTTDMANRLGRAFGMDMLYWLLAQNKWIEGTTKPDAITKRIKTLNPWN